MKRAYSLLSLSLLLLATAASADTFVSYTTSASFNGGGSTINFGSGTATASISYIPLTSTVLTPTFGSLGTMVVTATSRGAIIPVTNFVLTVTQTQPSSGSGSFSATTNLFGRIRQFQSTVMLTFSTTSIILGSASQGWTTYTLLSNPIFLVPPSTNSGRTTLQAFIDFVPPPVPEPASMVLFGTGLAIAAGIMRRRLVEK